MATVNIDKLASEIKRTLEESEDIALDDMEDSVKQVTKETVKELNTTSPNRTGDYAKAWTSRREPGKKDGYSTVVYNKPPHYRKTHLLEFGHDKVNNRGFVAARPHIKQAEENAAQRLEEQLTRKLQR